MYVYVLLHIVSFDNCIWKQISITALFFSHMVFLLKWIIVKHEFTDKLANRRI